MVLIGGYREAEYLQELFEKIKQQLFQSGIATLIKERKRNVKPGDVVLVCSKLLHAYCEHCDDLIGFKATTPARYNFPKIPFTVVENMELDQGPVLKILETLINNLSDGLDEQEIFDMSDEKFLELHKKVLEGLKNMILFRVYLHPQMPDFMREHVKRVCAHLRFVQLIDGAKMSYVSKNIGSTVRTLPDILLVAPYSDTRTNYVLANYKTKRAQWDNINAVKTHFAVKRVLDQHAVEVHIFRTPPSMDSEAAKNKIDEFRKTEGDEGFEVLSSYVRIHDASGDRIVNCSLINLLWMYDSEYYNEWTSPDDYGLSGLVTRKNRESELRQQFEQSQNILRNGKQFMTIGQRLAAAPIRKWSGQDL